MRRGFMEARLWRVAFLTHVCLLAAVLAPRLATADTSVTRVVTLTTPPAVRSRCSVTVNDDQTLTVKCNFENIDSVPKKFVVCLMLDLTKDLREEVAAPKGKAFDLSQDPLPTKDKPTGQLRCTMTGDTLSGGSSYHFGCRLVTLAPGLRQEISISSSTKYRAPKGLKKLRADQFQVKYLDVIDILRKQELEAKILGVKQVIVTFDADGKCAAVNGQANMVTPMTQIAGGDEIGAIWQYDEEPFKDPFIYYQPLAGSSPVACDVNRDGFIDLSDVQAIFAARGTAVAPGDPRDPDGDGVVTVNDARICTLRITRLYAQFADTPCVPSGFPEQVPQLPVCPLRAGSAPPSNVDLNLFFYVSEAAPPGTPFPTTLNVVESGDASGVRIRTDPPRDTVFNIVGQSAAIGAMQACSTSDLKHCVAPDLPEGSRLDVRVNFVSTGGSLRFAEQGGFVEDTVPPMVQSLNVSFDAAGGLAATLTATDATTSPIGAEFWYSLDHGVSWNSVTLRPTTDILDGIPTRAFRGAVGPFEHGQQIRYFASVQDEVFNRTYVGMGTAIVP